MLFDIIKSIRDIRIYRIRKREKEREKEYDLYLI